VKKGTQSVKHYGRFIKKRPFSIAAYPLPYLAAANVAHTEKSMQRTKKGGFRILQRPHMRTLCADTA